MENDKEKLCNERHSNISSEMLRHQKWLGTLQNDFNKIQVERGEIKSDMRNVSNQVKEVKKLQFWIIGLVVTNLAAFFFDAVKKGEVTKVAIAYIQQFLN